jgi:tyrosyl-tRNA synthetase
MESEQGISFTEFTYQLLQGYDFVHLCKCVATFCPARSTYRAVCGGSSAARRFIAACRGERR